MEVWQILTLIFLCMVFFILLGLPLAFVLAGVSIIFTIFIWGEPGLFMFISTAYSTMSNFLLIAVPLFILMANLLKHSGMADEVYETTYIWMGKLKGGLAMASVVACSIFAAMTGTSAGATVTVGLIALPAMVKRGYDKKLAGGSIAAGGALGILIPPSIPMIIYGMMVEESVGALFMAGVIPGIILIFIFILYIGIRAFLQPRIGPAMPHSYPWKRKVSSLKAIALPAILVFCVLGAIYIGVCTPTEAAGLGAFGAFLITLMRRKLKMETIKEALLDTLKLTNMVIWIMVGGAAFTAIVSISGATRWLCDVIGGWQVSPIVIIVIIQVMWMILGCFVDAVGMLMITIPLIHPIIVSLGINKIWLGVLYVVNSEMAFLTPPLGFNLYYVKSILGRDITMGEIYRAVGPFVICHLLGLILFLIFPVLSTWLPSTMIR